MRLDLCSFEIQTRRFTLSVNVLGDKNFIAEFPELPVSSQQPKPFNPHGHWDLALLQLVTFTCLQHALKLICINQFSATCSCKYIRSCNSVTVEPAVNNCYYLGRSVARNCCAHLTVFYSKSFSWQFQFVTKFRNLEIQVYIQVCLAFRPLPIYYIGVGVCSVHSEFVVENSNFES